MYRIVLACDGVPAAAGANAATDIMEEFQQHRPWHANAECRWEEGRLVLQAENDYDEDGLALVDEFSDSISAYIEELFDGGIRVVSITHIPCEPDTLSGNAQRRGVT